MNVNPSPTDGGRTGSEGAATGADPFTLSDLLDQFPACLVVAEAPSGRIVVYSGEAGRVLGHPLIPVTGTADYVAYAAVHADGSLLAPEDFPLSRALGGDLSSRDRAVPARRWAHRSTLGECRPHPGR